MPNYIPLSDDYSRDDIELLFGDYLQGVTTITRDLIRPLWQKDMPQQPAIGTDWVAFGIRDEELIHYPVFSESAGQNVTQQSSQVNFNVYCVFYGEHCYENCTKARDSLFIAQNREPLMKKGVKLVGMGQIQRMPELYNNQWYDRCDMDVYLTRAYWRQATASHFISGSVTTTVQF